MSYLLPADLGQERLRDWRSRPRVDTNVLPSLDRPEGYRQANPIKTCAGDLGNILLRNERAVMVFHYLGEVLSPAYRRALD